MSDDAPDRPEVQDSAWRRRIDAARRGVLDHPAERRELFSSEELAAIDELDSAADREDRRTV